MVIHAAADLVRLQSSINWGVTADAENQTDIASTCATERIARFRHFPADSVVGALRISRVTFCPFKEVRES
jgi:hypothetical protein